MISSDSRNLYIHEFQYQAVTTILSKRIENFISYNDFQHKLARKNSPCLPYYYHQLISGKMTLPEIAKVIDRNDFVDYKDISSAVEMREKRKSFLMLNVPNYHPEEKSFFYQPEMSPIVLEIYAKVDIQQFSSRGHDQSAPGNPHSVTETVSKEYLLERWEIKNEPISNQPYEQDPEKSCVVALRALLSYIHLLPAYAMYDSRLQNKKAENEIFYRILHSQSNASFISSRSYFEFTPIPWQRGELKIRVDYLTDLSEIPKPQINRDTVVASDNFLGPTSSSASQSPLPSEVVHTRNRTYSMPPSYGGYNKSNQSSNPIDIPRSSHPHSQARSQPRDIPVPRHSNHSSYSSSYGHFSGPLPFASYEPSPNQSIGTPPFQGMETRPRSVSNSSAKMRPNFGNITPFDSPPIAISNRSSLRNRDSFGFTSRSQGSSYERKLLDLGTGSLPRVEEQRYHIGSLEKNENIFPVHFLSDDSLHDEGLSRINDCNESIDLPFAEEDNDTSPYSFFQNISDLESLSTQEKLSNSLKAFNAIYEQYAQ